MSSRCSSNEDSRLRPLRRWAVLATVCLAVTVIVMDGSIVNVALPTLVEALGGASNSQLQWIVDAYVLSFAAFLLSAGSAADRHGRRRLLLIGLGLFALMSVGAAFSATPVQLILWRGFMGIGAAMIFPSTLAILTEAFPEPRLRRLAIAAWAGCSGLGVAIGPVVGGWLLAHYHWGSIFFVNVPLIALAIVGAALWVRESRDPHTLRFDLVGNVLAVVGLLALVWGLIQGPEMGWASAKVLSSLGVSAAMLGGFIAWESRISNPMLNLALFRNRRFTTGCLAITAAFFGLFGFVFMVTQYFQFICGYSALSAGVRTLPFAGFILIGSALAARSASLLSPRVLTGLGLLLMSIGFAWSTQDLVDTPYLTLVCQMGFLGVGLGSVSASATEVVMGSFSTVQFGVASSINDTTRELGGTFGVAMMGSLFNAVYRGDVASAFAAAPLPMEAKSAMQHSVGVALSVIEKIDQVAGAVAAQAVRERIQDAFIHGFHAGAVLAAASALAGGLVVLFRMPRGVAVMVGAGEEQIGELDPIEGGFERFTSRVA